MDMSRRDEVRATTRLIGTRIRMGRVQRGVSQEALAAALGISFQQVQKYENGKNRVAACTLLAIAAELRLDISFFLPACTVTAIGQDEMLSLRSQISDAYQAIDDAIGTLSRHRDTLGVAADRVALPALTRELEAA